MMKKILLLPAFSAFALLSACSGATEAPKDDAAAAETPAAADDDNDSAAPAPAKAEDDHPHDGSEGADHKH